MSRVLILAAHPDDDVLGCGGTIVQLIKAEHEVRVAFFTDGVGSRGGDYAHDLGADKRRINTENACRFLGSSFSFLGPYADNAMDTYPLLRVVKDIEALLDSFAPEVLFTHFEDDMNIDHSVVFKATMTAARPVRGGIEAIYSYEVPSSTEWGWSPFEPNVYKPLSIQALDMKCDAMLLYEDETREYPHPRSDAGIFAWAQKRGMECGHEYAEAFKLIRSIDMAPGKFSRF